MAELTSRSDLKEYCLRRLGKPVVEINVEDTQIDDRLDDALQYFSDYHHDGMERDYVKHQITQQDITNGYIDLGASDSLIISVVRLFRLRMGASSLFDVQYQYLLNQMYSIGSIDLMHFDIMKSYLQLIQDYLTPDKSLQFNRHKGKVYINTNWTQMFRVGDYLVFEVWKIVDPTAVSRIFNNRFLKDYTTALIKRQWGENLKKFGGIQLLGGVSLNGKEIYDEAVEEIKHIHETMQSMYEEPPEAIIG